MLYDKPALTVAEQIAQLKSRGLVIRPEDNAGHYLSQISYYRLAGYWWTMQVDSVNHTFTPNSRFATVIARYDFDRELRLIVLNMIERIEVAMRTKMVYHLSLGHGPYWFENKNLTQNNKFFKENLRRLDIEVKRSGENFIKEHRKKYSADKRNPPAWKSLEIISLGLLSKIYANLRSSLPEKNLIASNFSVHNHTYLLSWLRNASVVRNTVAHHSRLYRRAFAQSPQLPDTLPLAWLIEPSEIRVSSVYAALCCMKYLLHTISPDNSFTHRLVALFEKYPLVNNDEIGMPENWRDNPLWKTA